MLISDLSYLQSVGVSTVKGGYYKYYVDIDVTQKAYAGKVYVKAYKSDVDVDANATNKSYISIEF
jgi:predicted sulfurtransferase